MDRDRGKGRGMAERDRVTMRARMCVCKRKRGGAGELGGQRVEELYFCLPVHTAPSLAQCHPGRCLPLRAAVETGEGGIGRGDGPLHGGFGAGRPNPSPQSAGPGLSPPWAAEDDAAHRGPHRRPRPH